MPIVSYLIINIMWNRSILFTLHALIVHDTHGHSITWTILLHNLLFGNSLFCSKSLILNSHHEWFALLKRAMWVICMWYKWIARKNERFAQQIPILICFLQFFHFFMHKSESLMSLIPSFFKEQLQQLTPVTHHKKVTWAIHSVCS